MSDITEVQACIFDVDGTLLDSMPVWDDIGERYLTSLGISAREGLHDVLNTMSLEQGAVYLKEEYQIDKPIPQIVKEVLKIVSDFYRFEAPLKPGVKETLEWLSEKKIKMVIATSSNKELVEAALERNGVLQYFEQIYTCTEVGAGKDEPKIYLEAAKFLQTKPENTAVFEDAIHAAESFFQRNLTILEASKSDLRSLCIKKCCNRSVIFLAKFSQLLDTSSLFIVRSM